MNLTDIFVGICAAAFLIFIRNAVLVAQHQKNVSTRLDAYLRYWRRIVLENDWFSIFYMGVEWNKEVKELIQKGGSAEDLVKLKEEKRETINEFKVDLEKDPSDFKEGIDLMKTNINRLPTKIWDDLASNIMVSNQNLIEGKTFISDEEASYLDPYIASVCIDLKMKLVTSATNIMILANKIWKDSNEFEIKSYSQEVSNLLWQGVLISKDIDTLSNGIEKYTSNSVLALTAKNVGL